MMQECDVCVYHDYLPDYPPCSNCLSEHDVSGRFSLFCKALDESEIFEEKPSNADRIRSMTDEELAEFLNCHNFCARNFDCEKGKRPCKECNLDWLRTEVTG